MKRVKASSLIRANYFIYVLIVLSTVFIAKEYLNEILPDQYFLFAVPIVGILILGWYNWIIVKIFEEQETHTEILFGIHDELQKLNELKNQDFIEK